MLRHFTLLVAMFCSSAWAETLVVYNARGYTPADNGAVQFTGMVVADGKVQRLLSNGEVPKIDGAVLHDMKGAFVLPGLIDAHGHVLGLGQEKIQVDLRGSPSLADALDRVRAFAKANPNDRWIVGRGWNQVLWDGREFPTAKQLDAAVGDRPAILTRIDGHAIWVNSAALKLAGIDRSTRAPEGGQIVRDAQGDATGIFVDAASALIEGHVPAASDADITRALEAAMRELAMLGITAVHDAGIDERQYRLYEQLGTNGRLPIRIYAMLADSKDARAVIARGPKGRAFTDRLQMRAVKAWVDGALGSRGAALLNDYHDQPNNRGLLLYSKEELRTLTTLTARHGWQLNIHAIGDAGNRIALDVLSDGMTQEQRNRLRPRIEHAQVISLDDLPRFAQLNVIASIQPTHATSDMNMAEDRVGRDRIRGAYAWRRLLDAKTKLAGGSDFPVELANPFLGLHAAVTRQDRNERPPEGWYPDQKLSREEALRLFTIDAAYAGHMEDATGSLQPGRWADFVVIDRDYFSVAANEIADINVTQTWLAGQRVSSK